MLFLCSIRPFVEEGNACRVVLKRSSCCQQEDWSSVQVLSVETALSIQSHPDKALAQRLHARSPDVSCMACYLQAVAVVCREWNTQRHVGLSCVAMPVAVRCTVPALVSRAWPLPSLSLRLRSSVDAAKRLLHHTLLRIERRLTVRRCTRTPTTSRRWPLPSLTSRHCAASCLTTS